MKLEAVAPNEFVREFTKAQQNQAACTQNVRETMAGLLKYAKKKLKPKQFQEKKQHTFSLAS